MADLDGAVRQLMQEGIAGTTGKQGFFNTTAVVCVSVKRFQHVGVKCTRKLLIGFVDLEVH